MTKLSEVVENMENYGINEYRYYGIRAHYSKAVVGEKLENSKIWIDGDATEDEESGVCALDVFNMVENECTIDEIIESVDCYSYGTGSVVLIAGNDMYYGDDTDEIIIKNAIVVDIVK